VAVGFAIQTVVGAMCFLVVLCVAAGLAAIVQTLEKCLSIPPWLSLGASVVEKAIFLADIFVYGLLILSETLKFARTLWREWKVNG
jgi:hypothetical protein